MSTRQFIRWLGYTLSALGVILLGYCVYVLVDARIFQARESERLEKLIVQEPKPGPGPPAVRLPRPERGGTLGKLEIDRLGISVVVLEGTDARSLKLGVGHLVSSAVPGEAGNVVVAGHRDTFFRPLRDARVGDVIRLSTAESTRRYVVESATVVDPDRTEVLQPTPDPTLTLVTCFPFYFVGHAPERFVVRALEVAGGELQSTTLVRPVVEEERPSPIPAKRAATKRRKPISDQEPAKPQPATTAALVPPPIPAPVETRAAPAPKPKPPEPQIKDDPPPASPSVPVASNPEPRRERNVFSRLNPVRAVGRLGKLLRRQPKDHAATPE